MSTADTPTNTRRPPTVIRTNNNAEEEAGCRFLLSRRSPMILALYSQFAETIGGRGDEARQRVPLGQNWVRFKTFGNDLGSKRSAAPRL